LLCISREIFEKLCSAAQEFFVQRAAVKVIPLRPKITESLFRRASKLPLRNLEETSCFEYVPTKIWATRYSEFWQWQRVSDWWREFGQDE
jgi:hypothetical protein